MTQSIVEAWGVMRDYYGRAGVVHALRGIDLQIAPGEFVALRGRSGSGKTTLLNILVGLDTPTSGQVITLGHDLARLSDDRRANLRREHIGIMFQNAHLFPLLTAQENVEVMLRFAGVSRATREEQARRALDLVKLGQRARHRGVELSGGEQQRVALARALVHSPQFLIADEPTGNLDSLTGRQVISLLRDLVRQFNIGLLVATHDQVVIGEADRILQISDGKIAQV